MLNDGGVEFMKAFDNIVRERMEAEKEWIKSLRKRGIKAAHPDDGWVNKEHNIVFLSHPQFFDGVNIGDTIALGDADKYRLVKVVSMRTNELSLYDSMMIHYYFEEIQTRTYGDIFTDFKNKIDEGMLDDITDCRPASKMYSGVDLAQGIIAWFKDGSKMIYIPK
ncbi:F-BAR domain-containing protein [Bacteroides sp.]|uniref:F-BAR domain-containing protein n=1 Tax=Bacteroides sp. TaxID=29523 RepID=UPI0026155802|nr:F-BAR domain-containing protein [Bacteroides sp.]MDD3040057.1 F-BAR domain-containing protein [Bacteroides sp.]